jgi:hypothetical protein
VASLHAPAAPHALPCPLPAVHWRASGGGWRDGGCCPPSSPTALQLPPRGRLLRQLPLPGSCPSGGAAASSQRGHCLHSRQHALIPGCQGPPLVGGHPPLLWQHSTPQVSRLCCCPCPCPSHPPQRPALLGSKARQGASGGELPRGSSRPERAKTGRLLQLQLRLCCLQLPAGGPQGGGGGGVGVPVWVPLSHSPGSAAAASALCCTQQALAPEGAAGEEGAAARGRGCSSSCCKWVGGAIPLILQQASSATATATATASSAASVQGVELLLLQASASCAALPTPPTPLAPSPPTAAAHHPPRRCPLQHASGQVHCHSKQQRQPQH